MNLRPNWEEAAKDRRTCDGRCGKELKCPTKPGYTASCNKEVLEQPGLYPEKQLCLDSIKAFNNPKFCYLFLYIVNLNSTCGCAFVLRARDIEFILSLEKNTLSSDNGSGRLLRAPLYSIKFLKTILPVR